MRLSIRLGIISVINIGVSFLFQWYVFTQLGPGVQTDALFAGMTLPQLVLAVISGSLMHVLVPLLAGEDEECLRQDAWGFLIVVGGVFGFLAIILYLFAPWWVPLTVPGFDQAGRALTVDLTRIQLVGMVFAAINGVQWAAYHARQQFIWAEVAPILASIFALILLILALPRFGVIAAAWISAFRMVLQTLFLVPGMGRPVRPDLKSANFQKAWMRLKPLLVGTTYYKTDPLIDRFLLSTASSGSLSLYYLAQQIYGAASQVVNKAIAVPLVPILSKLHKLHDIEEFRRVYRRKLLQVAGLTTLGILIICLFGQYILNLFVGYGNVSANDVAELWLIMVLLGGVFAGAAAGQICSSSFYACGDTLTPTRMSIFTYTSYVPIKIAVFYFYGLLGLSIITSIYYLSNLFIQIYLLEKKIYHNEYI